MKKRTGGRKVRDIKDRFWEKVLKTNTCWLWLGSKQKSGHGQLGKGGIGGKYAGNYRAHRFSWILHHGEINDPNLCVCHKCDNPSCVNPGHLFLATQKENLEDMTLKGRRKWNSGIGEKNNNYGKHWNQEFKDKMASLYSKEYELTKEDGSKIRIKNLKKFCRENNYSDSPFHNLKNKKVNYAYGYIKIEKINI